MGGSCSTRGGEEGTYRVLVGKREGKNSHDCRVKMNEMGGSCSTRGGEEGAFGGGT